MTNTATVSGGEDTDSTNNTASDPTTVNESGTIAPTRLVATAFPSDISQVSVSWDAVTKAASYRVHRSSDNRRFDLVGTASGTTFTDTGLPAGRTYLYRVEAVNQLGAVSPPSNVDLATTIAFTDDPLVAIVKAIHFTELRTAVDAVRAAAGVGKATYTNAITAGAVIKAADLTELRSNLDQARSLIGVPPLLYFDPAITPGGTTIKRVHITEIRAGTQ